MNGHFEAIYRFEKAPSKKTRFDVTARQGIYQPFKAFRNKQSKLFLYLNSNDYVKWKRAKYKLVNSAGKHLTSIYFIDQNKKYAYGDFNNDLLIFLFNDDRTSFDILIAQGKKHDATKYISMLQNGMLDAEILSFREQVKPDTKEGL